MRQAFVSSQEADLAKSQKRCTSGPLSWHPEQTGLVGYRSSTKSSWMSISGCILGSCIASYCAAAMHGVETGEQSRLLDLDRLFIGAIAGYVHLGFSFGPRHEFNRILRPLSSLQCTCFDCCERARRKISGCERTRNLFASFD